MDDATRSTSDSSRTLKDLAELNRRFGGHRYLRAFLKKRLQPGLNYRVLDVGTGGGDFPRVMVDWGRENGVNLVVDALDANPEIIQLARDFSADYPEIRYMAADILDYVSDRNYYDLVHGGVKISSKGTTQGQRISELCPNV